MLRKVLALAAVVGALAWLERRHPLRTRTQPTGRRTAINVAMMSITAVGAGPVHAAVLGRVTAWAERHGIGITRWLPLPGWLARATGVVLLDYTLWHWHRLNHRIPGLWSMHAPHHADLDLDASTALRFHLGEMLASIPVRAAQVIVFGIDRWTLRAWETTVLVAILFHHANLRLPARLEVALSTVVITPRLHGLHHAARPDRLDTNFGTLLAIWDTLHGTRATEPGSSELELGLPHMLGRQSLGLMESLLLPLS